MRKERQDWVQKLIEDLKDPNSEASIRSREYFKEVAEQQRLRDIEIQKHYEHLQTFSSLDEYFVGLEDRFKEASCKASEAGTYIETIDEQWLVVEVGMKYGRDLTDYERERLGDSDWSGNGMYFRGYIFGIAHGQGSYPWYQKWDTKQMGPEQLELF